MELCPCGSQKTYLECCEGLINGSRLPRSAEELMRSRYTAYVKQEISYILDTIAPEKRETIDREGIRRWSEKAQWQQLEIVAAPPAGPDDTEATVEFIAHYREKGILNRHHETGTFVKQNNRWYYRGAEFPKTGTVVRSQPKVMRNDPCPCGSGRKFKKCCEQ